MMSKNRPQIVDEETVAKIIADYKAGKKLRIIEETHGVTRSQVYWALKQGSVAPQRTKPKSRLDDGAEATVMRLYEIVEAQDKRLEQLDELVVLVRSFTDVLPDVLDDTPTAVDLAEIRARFLTVLNHLDD